MSLEIIESRLKAKLEEYQLFIDSKETFNTERNAAFEAEVRALDAQLVAAKAMEARKASDAKVVDLSHRGAPIAAAGEQRTAVVDNAKQLRAYDIFLRHGIEGVRADPEARTYSPMDSTDLTLGQFLVPVTTGDEIEKLIKNVGGIVNEVRPLIAATGEPLNWPTSDDTGNKGEFIAENGAVSQANPVFGNVVVGADQWSSQQVLVPLRLIQDSKFDVAGLLTESFADRAVRGFSDRIINEATNGLVNVAGTASMTAASATAVDYYEALTLQSKINYGYNKDAKYVMSFSTYLAYRNLKNAIGQQLWSPLEAEARMLHGRPVVISDDMPNSGVTGRKYLAFGNLQKILFRKAGPMEVFRFSEAYMTNLQQGFLAYQRVCSRVIQPKAIAILSAA